MIRFVVVGLALAALVGCAIAPPPPPPAPADKYVGQKRWISPTRPLYVWDGPPKPGDVMGQGTGRPIKSGSFTVEEATKGGLRSGYWIKFEDGRRVWTSDSLILTDDEADRARKLAEQKECDRKGGVSVGMTRAQVYASCWGKPQSINATRTANGESEQLVYWGNYVYLRNGIVTAIQTSQSGR